MRIHIMGASCAGSTTLGEALARQLEIPYFDTDDFFWLNATVPYSQKRDPNIRNQMLSDQITPLKSYIIGGSLVNWGEEWKSLFDLVILLYVPKAIRLERLVKREEQRYGKLIYEAPERRSSFQAFLDWASRYEDPAFSGRNLALHERWLESLGCKTLKIYTVDERIERIGEVMAELKNGTKHPHKLRKLS